MNKRLVVVFSLMVWITSSQSSADAASFPSQGAVFLGDSVIATGRASGADKDIAFEKALFEALAYAEEALVGVQIKSHQSSQKAIWAGSEKKPGYSFRFESSGSKELNEKFPFHYAIIAGKENEDGSISVTIKVSAEQIRTARLARMRIGLTEEGISQVKCPDTLDVTLCEHVSRVLKKELSIRGAGERESSEYWLGFKTDTCVRLNQGCRLEKIGEMITPEDPNICEVDLQISYYFLVGKGGEVVHRYQANELKFQLPQGTIFEVLEGFPVIHDDGVEQSFEKRLFEEIDNSAEVFAEMLLNKQ